MKLQECETDVQAVMMQDNPLRTRAANSWQQALRKGNIPQALFVFYQRADYFSPAQTPPFLGDSGRVLFSYLSTVAECIRENLDEANELRQVIRTVDKKIYNPLKGGTQAPPESGQKLRRALRDFLLNLSSCLDLLSDICALFFPRLIKGVKPGKASFSLFKEWLKKPLAEEPAVIIAPQMFYLRLLHDTLCPLIPDADSDRDWLSLFTLYRNKLIHFGALSFMDYRLYDKNGETYAFLPKYWPFIWQEHLSWGTQEPSQGNLPMQALIEQTCIHIDLLELTDGLHEKVMEILDKGFSVLIQAYEGLKDFGLNTAALEELRSVEQVLRFTDFCENLGPRAASE